jgi:hypothetical protein
MYKMEIELGWDEKITIETDDFNKIAILQEFIELQEECAWGDEELSYTDEDGVTWYYDEETDVWYNEEEEDEEEDEEDYE